MIEYPIAPDKLRIPVARATNPDGKISDNQILRYDCLNDHLKGLGQRAGYEENLSAYCFRRGYGYKLEKNTKVPMRRQMMGQIGDETFQFYLSNIVGVDTQNIGFDKSQRLDFIERFCSMDMNLVVTAPKPPRALLTDRDPPPLVDAPHLSTSQQYDLRRRTRDTAFQRRRQDFFKNPPQDDEIPLGGAALQDSTGRLIRTPSRFLLALLKYDPDRKNVIETLSSFTEGELPMKPLVEPMAKMARFLKPRFYYRGAESAEDGSCKHCMKRMKQFNAPNSLHKHMKSHLAGITFPITCPHPQCKDILKSEEMVWVHSNSVHGTPPLDPNLSRKRKAASLEDGTYLHENDGIGNSLHEENFDEGVVFSIDTNLNDSVSDGLSWLNAPIE
ncbi:hypothetical protein EJ04DRAFT_506713 [Polyplosphaeria fusca]|uniref:Uncharacterized protein n=1 Tax=Polyplosphaeria fusca TaxID=682080 RepID=A0A9P4UVH5_9PLEO|nr:hypothetical protein EJ04DRAFT_506713 [Polyplosphaeria fusca]